MSFYLIYPSGETTPLRRPGSHSSGMLSKIGNHCSFMTDSRFLLRQMEDHQTINNLLFKARSPIFNLKSASKSSLCIKGV